VVARMLLGAMPALTGDAAPAVLGEVNAPIVDRAKDDRDGAFAQRSARNPWTARLPSERAGSVRSWSMSCSWVPGSGRSARPGMRAEDDAKAQAGL